MTKKNELNFWSDWSVFSQRSRNIISSSPIADTWNSATLKLFARCQHCSLAEILRSKECPSLEMSLHKSHQKLANVTLQKCIGLLSCLITGRMERSAALSVVFYSRGRFFGFRPTGPRGDTLHRSRWNLRENFTLIGSGVWVYGPKTVKMWYFYQYNCP